MGVGTNAGSFSMEKLPAKVLSTVKYRTSDLMYMDHVLEMGPKSEFSKERVLKTRGGLLKVGLLINSQKRVKILKSRIVFS